MTVECLLYYFSLAISCLHGQRSRKPAEDIPMQPESMAYQSQPPSPVNPLQNIQKADWKDSDTRGVAPNKHTCQKVGSSKVKTEWTQNIETCNRNSLSDQIIMLPDPATGLYSGDEIIKVYESEAGPNGKQYRIRVRGSNADEAPFWAGEQVERRRDFQYLCSSRGCVV